LIIYENAFQEIIVNSYKDYVMVRVDEKTGLKVWVKLPPTGK